MSIDFKVALIVSDLRGFELAGFIIQLTLIELYRNMIRSQRSKVFFLKITNPLSGEQKVTNHKTDPKDSLQCKHKYKYNYRIHKRSERFITMLAGRLFLCFRDLRVVVWAELMQRGSVWNLNPLRPTKLTTTTTFIHLPSAKKKEEKV